MRVVLQVGDRGDRGFYVLRSAGTAPGGRRVSTKPHQQHHSAGSAGSPASSARVYDDQGFRELETRRQLLRRAVSDDMHVIFVAVGSEKAIGGTQDGFLKNLRTRTGTSFVQQAELDEHRAFWDEQRLWLQQQLGETVSYERRKRAGAAARARPYETARQPVARPRSTDPGSPIDTVRPPSPMPSPDDAFGAPPPPDPVPTLHLGAPAAVTPPAPSATPTPLPLAQ
eukprot:m51a1_g7267 hypothetical protein (226) ;mRNA; r:208524-209301